MAEADVASVNGSRRSLNTTRNGSSGHNGDIMLQLDKLLQDTEEDSCSDLMTELEVVPQDADVYNVDDILNQELPDALDQLDLQWPSIAFAQSDTAPEEDDCDSSLRTSRSSAVRAHDWKRPAQVTPVSPVLHVERQRGLSAQVQHASGRAGAGAATCIALSNTFTADVNHKQLIAVGCSHGTVLVFELARQQLLFWLTSKDGKQQDSGAAVAALAFNPDCSRLAVGYSTGALNIASVSRQKWILKLRAEQCHQAGHGILQLCYGWQDDALLVLDSGGSVFTLRISSGITGLSHRLQCIFSGCHGEVCYMLPLWLKVGAAGHVPPQYRPYADAGLVALVSLTKAMVVKLSDSQSVFAVELPGDTGRCFEWPPLVSWQWLPIQVSSDVRVVDPCLCVCRERSISVYELHSADGAVWHSFRVCRLQLPAPIIQLQWLNARCLLALDVNERVHVFEANDREFAVQQSSEPQAQLDRPSKATLRDSLLLTDVHLVYGSADFKGHSTGGNVSAAMACLADKVCYQSVASNLQGGAYVLGGAGLYLVSLRSWIERIEALVDEQQYLSALHLALAFYTGRLNAAVATTANQKKSSDVWRSLIADKVLSLVQTVIDSAVRQHRADQPDMDGVCRACIPVCIDACITVGRRDLLYGQLYESASLVPVARPLFLECLEDRLLDGKLPDIPPQIIQDYLQYLADESLFNSVECSIVRLPIESLDLHQVITLCRKHALWDGIIYVHNHALKDFISPLQEMCCLLSQVLREQQLLTDENILLGNKILLYISCCLCGRAYPIGSLDEAEAYVVSRDVYHFIVAARDPKFNVDVLYPHLRLLLRFDTREFLNVCTLGFECELFRDQPKGTQMMSEFIPILHQVLLDETEDWNTVHFAAYLTFLSRLLNTQAGLTCPLSKSTFMKVVRRALSSDVCGAAAADMSQALSDLLNSPVLQSLIDVPQLTELAEQANLLRLCEQLYWASRAFDRLVCCVRARCEQGIDQPHAVFTLLQLLFSSHKLRPDEAAAVVRSVVDNLESFASLSAVDTAAFLLEHSGGRLPELLECIGRMQPGVKAQLLHALFAQRQAAGFASLTGDAAADDAYFECLVTAQAELGDTAALADTLTKWDCLLENSSSLLDRCLSVCRSHRRVSAVVQLLVRQGNSRQAIDYVFEVVNEQLAAGLDDDGVPELCGRLRLCLTLLPAHTDHWQPLLNLVLSAPLQLLQTSAPLRTALSDVVHACVTSVRAEAVLDVLFAHEAFTACTYAQHRALLHNIIQAYEYDQVLLSSVVRCMQNECWQLVRDGLARSTRAVHVTAPVCCVCARVLQPTDSHRHARVFPCGHVCHVACSSSSSSNACPIHSGAGAAAADLAEAQQPDTVTHAVRIARANRVKQCEWHLNDDVLSESPSLFAQDRFPLSTTPANRQQ